MGSEAVALDRGMVDPERVIKAADEMAALAAAMPDPPPPPTFGTDPLSMTIKNAVSGFEERLQTGLPALKAAMLQTAADIGAAARAQRDLRRGDPAPGSAPPAGATPGPTSDSEVDRERGDG